jgi:hypothetical protein
MFDRMLQDELLGLRIDHSRAPMGILAATNRISALAAVVHSIVACTETPFSLDSSSPFHSLWLGAHVLKRMYLEIENRIFDHDQSLAAILVWIYQNASRPLFTWIGSWLDIPCKVFHHILIIYRYQLFFFISRTIPLFSTRMDCVVWIHGPSISSFPPKQIVNLMSIK